MNHTKFLAAIFVLCFALNVQAAGFSFNTPTSNLSIQKGLEASVPLEFSNPNNFPIDISVTVNSSNSQLQAVPALDSVLLNGNESTSFSLTIRPQAGIPDGTYNVMVRGQHDQNIVDKVISVHVFSTSAFDFSFSENDFDVCRDNAYTKNVTVTVNNNGGPEQRFRLFTDSEQFAPSFLTEELVIPSGSSRQSVLELHFNSTHDARNYIVPVIVQNATGSLVEKMLSFELKDCIGPNNDVPDVGNGNGFFEVSLEPDTLSMEREESETVHLKIKNLLSQKQKIFASVESDLEVTRPPYETEFLANEEKTFDITVTAQEDIQSGENIAKFFVWNENAEEERKLTVNVDAQSRAEVRVLNNNISQRICSAIDFEVFEIELENKGDFEEEFKIKVRNPYRTIGVEIPEDEIVLQRFEKQIVKVIVQPAFDTLPGEKEIQLEVRSRVSGKKFFETLKFTVIEPFAEGFANVLQITSAPVRIEAFEGEQKSFEVGLRNNGQTELRNVQARVFGADNQVVFSSQVVSSILPGQAKNLRVDFLVKDNISSRDYLPVLEVFSGEFKATQQFSLQVRKRTTGQGVPGSGAQDAPINPAQGIIAGFVAFLPKTALGGVSLILLIVATGIVIMALLSSNSYNEKQFWVLKNKEKKQKWAN